MTCRAYAPGHRGCLRSRSTARTRFRSLIVAAPNRVSRRRVDPREGRTIVFAAYSGSGTVKSRRQLLFPITIRIVSLLWLGLLYLAVPYVCVQFGDKAARQRNFTTAVTSYSVAITINPKIRTCLRPSRTCISSATPAGSPDWGLFSSYRSRSETRARVPRQGRCTRRNEAIR
jgi:hypothetical protein